jgi:hypothetical protein
MSIMKEKLSQQQSQQLSTSSDSSVELVKVRNELQYLKLQNEELIEREKVFISYFGLEF